MVSIIPLYLSLIQPENKTSVFSYKSIRAKASRRRIFRKEVVGRNLCKEPLSTTRSLCNALRLPPSSFLNDERGPVQRHLEGGAEVRSSKEGEVSR